MVINVSSYLFIIISLSIFLGITICIINFYRFYKKYDEQVIDAFSFLHHRGIIRRADYQLYEQLGVSGFGFRVSLLAKILKGKRFQLEKQHWVEPDTASILKEKYDFSWVSNFYRMIFVLGFFMVSLLFFALII